MCLLCGMLSLFSEVKNRIWYFLLGLSKVELRASTMPAWKSLMQLAGSEFVAKFGNMLILWLLTFKYGTETQGQWSLFMLLSTLLLRITSLNLGYGLRIEISKNQCTQPFRHLAVILFAQGSFILILYFAYSLFSSVIEYKFYRILC